jgi:hypothetical protein
MRALSDEGADELVCRCSRYWILGASAAGIRKGRSALERVAQPPGFGYPELTPAAWRFGSEVSGERVSACAIVSTNRSAINRAAGATLTDDVRSLH